MKSIVKNRIILFILGISIIANGYLFIENQNKNKTNETLEKYNSLFEMGTPIEFVDIATADGTISMVYLYQDKELIERHGIGVVVDDQYYRIGIAPEITTTLNEDSRIIKVTDNEVEFTYNLNNNKVKKRLKVNCEGNDVHFKLEDIS